MVCVSDSVSLFPSTNSSNQLLCLPTVSRYTSSILCCLDMKEANQSVRDHLVKQNLEVMEVIKSTFMHVVQKKTGKSLDEYLNALFSCLAVPYQGIASEDATALEVLEILSSLHEVMLSHISLNY